MAKEKKASKRKAEKVLVTESAHEVTKKSKKHRKEKRKSEECNSQEAKVSSKEKKTKHKSEKKKKKSKKDKKDSSNKMSVSPIHETTKSEEASDKNQKSDSKQENNGTGWTDWNKTSFGGDSARKEKFLKLMGAKKATPSDPQNEAAAPTKKGLFGSLKSSLFQPKATSSTYGTSTLSEQHQQKIQADLEHQFEEGLKFKKNMQRGAKRGLGA